jgi:hypothetical protein
MKNFLKNVMVTTGITITVLAMMATLYGAKFIFVKSVFQCLGANAVIHVGFLLTNRYESKYPILEALLDLTYAVTIIIIAGIIFKWYSSTPIWILVIMVLIIYLVGYFINTYRIKEDINEINKILRKRKDYSNS